MNRPPKIRGTRLLIASVASAVTAVVVFTLVVFASASLTGGRGTGDVSSLAAIANLGALVAMFWTVPTSIIAAGSGVPLTHVARRQRFRGPTIFVTVGAVEGAALMPLFWRIVWGTLSVGAGAVGLFVGAVAGFAFWLCVRKELQQGL